MKAKRDKFKFIKDILLVVFATMFAILVLYIYFTVDFSQFRVEKEMRLIDSYYQNDANKWAEIFSVEDAFVFDDVPRSLILPNTEDSFFELASFYDALSDVINPKLVVLIGLNSSDFGSRNIHTCRDCFFNTIEGEVKIDLDIAEDMIKKKVLNSYYLTFIKEKSIYAHMPFIKHYFPFVKVLPINVKRGTSPEELLHLREYLSNNLPENSLIIVSSNFSNHLTKSVSELHDQSSVATIYNFDYNNVMDLEVDSPESIYLVMSLMEKQGNKIAELLKYFNSQDLLTEPAEETTSSQFWAFFEGENEDMEEGFSAMSFGSMFEESDLEFQKSWYLDPKYDQLTDITAKKQLRDIRALEDRFFKGIDFLVFDLKNGICQEEKQNGVSVSFCKFREGDDGIIAVLRKLKSDYIYMLYDYAGGELTKEREKEAQEFVKYGVDVFVGRGIKELIPMKKYKEALLFYSLGDFLTSSKFANELTANSSGAMVGLFVTDKYYYVYLFPIDIINGYPKFIPFSERMKFYIEFTSDKSMGDKLIEESDLMNGIFKIKR